MNWRTLGGGVAVVLYVSAVGGLVVNLGIANELFVSSQWNTAALASIAFVLVSLCLFALLGRPWKRWQRTPYW
jgi:formate-dependent nitrite reductase membrane component NrfD